MYCCCSVFPIPTERQVPTLDALPDIDGEKSASEANNVIDTKFIIAKLSQVSKKSFECNK